MRDEFCILTCEAHHDEAALALEQLGFDNVRLESFPTRCGHPCQSQNVLAEVMRNCSCLPRHTIILAGGCLAASTSPAPELEGCRIIQHHDCTCWFADPSVVREHQNNGGYVLTSGWLQQWKSVIQGWGFDRPTAKEFFQESARRLVLLDTSIHPLEHTERVFAAFSEYVGLPSTRIAVGLNRFGTILQREIYELRQAQLSQQLAAANRRVADYATATEFVTQLASAKDEHRAVELAFTHLETFCAPKRLAYLPVIADKLGELQQRDGGDPHETVTRMKLLQGDHAWTPSGAGFTLRVPDGENTVGFVEIDGMAFPERREEYLDIALGLVTALGMAVRNARSHQQARRFNNAISRSGSEIYMFDATTLRFVDVNHGARRNLGYSLEELRERTPVDIKPELDAARFAELVEPLRSGAKDRIRFETKHLRKDGSTYPVQVSLELVRGASPTFVAIIEDRTEALAAEQRQQEIAEQLRQAQKMEAVGRLAGGVAHDFNNILTIILGSCDFLLDELPKNSPHLADVQQIQEAGQRAQSLTRQLLAFGRRQALRPELVDLNKLIGEMDRILLRILGEDIVLKTLPSAGLWHVKADAGQLGQVVMNLAINARDAMPEGGKLTIETDNVELDEQYASTHLDVAPGPYVMLAVSDTGKGMDAETKAKIFDPFFTTKGVGKGTGLGLATVHGIVKQSGGSIWIYSEPESGTTFKIFLPRAEGRPVRPSKEIGAQARSLGSETVLIVEDESPVLDLAARVLERQGYNVLKANCGAEALRVAEQYAGRIDLLLTDVVMPGQSGRVTAEQLLEVRPNLLVLYMSGYTDNAILHHGVLDSGTNFIEKPFSQLALVRAVRSVLDGSGDGFDAGPPRGGPDSETPALGHDQRKR